jgi:hypothetical protein
LAVRYIGFMCCESPGRRPLSKLVVLLLAAGISLQGQRNVWFTPVPAGSHPVGFFGSTDYMKLFSPDAPWQQAASRVQVFKVYADGLADLSDAELRTLIAGLKRRKIALALEWPVLTSRSCGQGIEGFGGAGLETVLQRIKRLGGTLAYLAMQQPFQWGSLYKGPGACRWTARQVAVNALIEVNFGKKVFPGLLVGDIMAVPPFRDASDWAGQYGVWFETWRKLAGSPLAFFHVDADWTVPNWQAAVAAVRPVAAQHRIPFGMVYNGFLTDESDTAWIHAAEEHFIDYEVRGGNAPPEQVGFQSWNPHPTRVLPETDPTAFTWLIDRYFRTRTQLTINASGDRIAGTLRAGAAAVPGAAIQISAQPLSGSGAVATYTVTGTVPAQARTAMAGMRIHSECYLCSGSADVTVYSFQYSENTQRKPVTWDFSKGISGWSYGPGTPVLEPGFSGQALHIKAQTGQTPGMNSGGVTVTPGAQFKFQVVARVAPSSAGSGYFTLIWLNAGGAEPSREILMLEPQTRVLGSVTTGRDGSFSMANSLDPTLFKITADYAGSGTLWPANKAARNR